MKKIVVLLMIVSMGISSFAQKQKTIKKDNLDKEDFEFQQERPFRQNLMLTPEEMIKVHKQELKRKYNMIERGLKLEKETMEKFWMYYLEYEEQKFKINLQQTTFVNDLLKKYIEADKEGEKFDFMMLKDEDASILLKQQTETERQIFGLTQKYMDVFRELLSPQQLLKLKELEQDNKSNMARYRMKNDFEFVPSIENQKR